MGGKKIHMVHKVEELEVPKGSLNLALISKDGDIKAQSQQGWARGSQQWQQGLPTQDGALCYPGPSGKMLSPPHIPPNRWVLSLTHV